jgi:hypothetical protein
MGQAAGYGPTLALQNHVELRLEQSEAHKSISCNTKTNFSRNRNQDIKNHDFWLRKQKL